MAFDWSPDYCLSCDREAPHGAAYCSQACRLADLERASCSSSPKTTASSGSSNAGGSFYLPPAFNFSAISKSSTTSASNTATWTQSSSSSKRKTTAQSGIYASPSRTSLSSMPSQYSNYEPSCLSDKAARELSDYANCFDQVRDNKRRMTVF